MAGELEPLGIRVIRVEPGPTATSFGNNLDLAAAIADYDQTVRAVQKSIGELPPEAFNAPERVAAAIISMTGAGDPPRRPATGSTAVREMRAALRGRLDELDTWAATSGQGVGQGIPLVRPAPPGRDRDTESTAQQGQRRPPAART